MKIYKTCTVINDSPYLWFILTSIEVYIYPDFKSVCYSELGEKDPNQIIDYLSEEYLYKRIKYKRELNESKNYRK